MVSLPHPPLSCITVMSLDGNSSCFHVSDLIDALTSVTVLGGVSEFQWRVGYTRVQSLDAKVKPFGFMYGSWRVMSFIPLFTKSLLLMRLC